MSNFLSKISLVNKLRLSFTIIILMAFGLVAFSYVSMGSLKGVFIDYKAQYEEAFLLANLVEDFSEARMASLKYRLASSDSQYDQLVSNIQDIIDADDDIKKIVTYEKHLNELVRLTGLVVEYREAFRKASALQKRYESEKNNISSSGTEIRREVTGLIEEFGQGGRFEYGFKAAQAQQYILLGRAYAQRFFNEKNENDKQRTLSEMSKAAELLTVLAKSVSSSKRETVIGVVQDLETFKTDFIEAAALGVQSDDIYVNRLDVIGPQVLDAYDVLFTDIQTKQNELGPQAYATMNDVSRGAATIGILASAVAAVLAYLISVLVRKNFASIIGQMERLSKGDKSFDIAGADRHDEMGDMAKALEVFRQNALEVDRLEAQRKEDEAKQEERERQKTLELIEDFETRVGHIVKEIDQAALDMQTMAKTIATAVQNTTTQSGTVAAASQEASTNVETVASAAEEMSASIQEISKNVTETAQAAKDCAQSAGLSQDKLRELQQAVDEIDSVIQSINDVAEQTNLLALNATIEAARAGEAGKGFAVVASEVKSLANETHKMTEEISRKVEGIKNSAGETIDSVNSIIEQISSVDHKTTSVAAAVEEQNSATVEISRNVQEAAAGTGEVSRSIEEVQKVANETSASTDMLREASDGLAEQSTKLKTAVDSFLDDMRQGV